jgi:hypothetical protein
MRKPTESAVMDSRAIVLEFQDVTGRSSEPADVNVPVQI